jgi:MinD-like ATPase involved in chromosome partitioning or flagellar assembly
VSGAPLPVLTAVGDQWEAPLVRGLEQHRDRLQVVRRCADLADVLATAGSGRARVAVLSADLRGLDGDALARLADCGCAVVALAAPGDEWSERRLRQLGLRTVLSADAASADVAAAVLTAVQEVARQGPAELGRAGGLGHAGQPSGAAASLDHDRPGPASTTETGPGRVVVVWGPAGAPGRTTTAVNLAAELVALGRRCVLVDADTYAASIGQVLGLLDEAPALAAAARAADHGSLDVPALSRLAPEVTPGLRVITGLASAHRWTELRPGSLSRVLALARSLGQWCVVDVASGLEQDEELVYDTAAPRRNGATRTALEDADLVVAVGTADPVGLQRLVGGLHDLAEVGRRPDVVVVTRLRASAVGTRSLSPGGPARRVGEALQRYAGVDDLVLVPDDVPALDAALLLGRTLVEAAPASAARLAYQQLAQRLDGPAEQASRQSRRRRRGRRTVVA